MAKYTLELRDIIESYNVELFDFDYEYYADNMALQRRFENTFIEHYYFHEIGFETIERFKWNLRARLNLNAPKYKQLWDSYLKTKNIDFTVNKEYLETVTRELETENASSSSSKNNSTSRNDGRTTNEVDTKSSSISDGVSMSKLDDDYITHVQKDFTLNINEDVYKAENLDESKQKH